MFVLPIFILAAILLMLFYSQPVRAFSLLKWVMIAATALLIVLYGIELVNPR